MSSVVYYNYRLAIYGVLMSIKADTLEKTYEVMRQKLDRIVLEIELEDTLAALRKDRYQIEVPEEIRIRAKKSIDRMLMIG